MAQQAQTINITKAETKTPICGLPSGSPISVIVDDRKVVPLIFVPGLMGSRLQKSSGELVWDPDSDYFMLTNYGMKWVSAAARKELLVGSVAFSSAYLDVCETHPDLEPKKLHYQGEEFTVPSSYPPEAKERGWAGLMLSCYGSLLIALMHHQWSDNVSRRFRLPVHSFGYNWTASIDLAGHNLRGYIDEVMKKYQNCHGGCDKVILITHSMGGLVARAACKLADAEPKVLGIIHGVQPASGAPAAYWRMKAGFERPTHQPRERTWDWVRSPVKMIHSKAVGRVLAWTLGTDGEEVTSLLGNMPGALQLLPTKFYSPDRENGEKTWLTFLELDGSLVRLPKSDPYEEIYRERDRFYRLVEPHWLDPGQKRDKTKNIDANPWRLYLIYLRKAESFHEELEDKVHRHSIQFYSRDLSTVDVIRYSREIDNWTTKAERVLKLVKESLPDTAATTSGEMVIRSVLGTPLVTPTGLAITAASIPAFAAVKDSDWWVNRGGYRVRADQDDKPIPSGDETQREVVFFLTLQSSSGLGDGTVPNSSGTVLGRRNAGVKTFSIGARESRQGTRVRADYEESWLDIGHQDIFKTKAAQAITFGGVERLLLS